MTKYTAADFANAQFAKHPDGRTARRIEAERGTVFAWSMEHKDGDEDYCADEHLVDHGWVPVHTKPTITELIAAFNELSKDLKNRTTILACELERAGIANVPDPEPTNTDRLEQLIKDYDECDSYISLPEFLDQFGVTAPNAKGN